MKRFDFLIWSAVFFIHCTVYAQDQNNFTQFYLNPYLINPSYAGIDGKASVSFIYRHQWSTIPDGPRISNVSLHTPATKRLSLGFSATNDQKGLLNNSAMLVTFGYSVPMGEGSFLRFGISGGGAWNTIDLEKLNAIQDDPALANLLENNASLAGNAGISVHIKSFHAGLALPVIFAPSYISKDAFTITEIKPFQTLNLHLSNRFYFANNKHIFEPYVVYRMSADNTASLPPQFEVAGILHLNHVVWVGGSFKEDYGISALGGIKLKNTFAIGGAYSIKNSGVNELASPSFEVALGILFGQKRKEALVYSFVNTEKEKPGKTPSQIAAEKKRQEELAKKKQQEEELAKQKQEEEQARQQEQALAKQREDEARKQQQQEAEARRQEDAMKMQQEADARKLQQEVDARRQQDEQTRLQQEALARRQQEETAKKLQEEQARQQDEARKQQEALAKQEEERRQQQQTQTSQTQTQQSPVIADALNRPPLRLDTVRIFHRPRFTQIDATMETFNIEITEHSEHDEHERIARLSTHAEDPDEHHDGEEDHPNAERHEFYKRGTHRQELHVSDYVISGVFGQENNAKHFTEGLKRMGFKANYGHLTEKNLWYVYLVQTTDIKEARAERDKFRKMKLFRDAWLLTVHN